jgi:hypothetical protein
MLRMSRAIVAVLLGLTIGACLHDWDKYEPATDTSIPGGGAAGDGGAGGTYDACADASDLEARCAVVCDVYRRCVSDDGDCDANCVEYISDCLEGNADEVCTCAAKTQEVCSSPTQVQLRWYPCISMTCYGQ